MNLRIIDEDQIVQRTGIGDNDAAHSLLDTSQRGEVAGKLLRGGWAERLGLLEERVRLPPIQFQYLACLRVTYPPSAVRLRHQRLQCAARKIGRFATQRLEQRIGK